ncbi:MAG TPA: MerR family transcriptional regulator [Burkholderiaceae bacterium]|nr:MerR family transcriptional regulator [Burkholderiaceae bacterium]
MPVDLNPPTARPVMLSIAAVERDTGLSKDTLRVWERRYGFPLPARDTFGERRYPFEQVEKLRIVKRLLDAGHRPGRVVAMPTAELERLAATLRSAAGRERAVPPTPVAPGNLLPHLRSVQDNDVRRLRRSLAAAASRLGLGRFVLEVAAPLNAAVGEAWMQGRLEVFQEHLYTESMQVVLRHALHQLPAADRTDRPRVVLATVSGEPHGLGLLMAEAVLALDGCDCVSLGVQTPLWDVVRAATALDADIVALGYTGCANPNHVIDGLVELRAKLRPSTALWAGGSAPVLQRRLIDGVRALPTLEDVAPALADWRAAHAAASAATMRDS